MTDRERLAAADAIAAVFWLADADGQHRMRREMDALLAPITGVAVYP